MATKQPPFKTGSQEADRWAKNQNFVADRFEQAAAAAKLGKGTVAQATRQMATQSGPSPTITIRLAETDITRAKTFAAEKGLRYQTYLKMLVRQALNSEEKDARRRWDQRSRQNAKRGRPAAPLFPRREPCSGSIPAVPCLPSRNGRHNAAAGERLVL